MSIYFSSGVNCVDFMASVSDQTKVIQQGLKTLRGEVDNPMRVLDIGQEAIVLSGLNKSAGESLKNIKNLYDETKYLKSHLEKVRSQDIAANFWTLIIHCSLKLLSSRNLKYKKEKLTNQTGPDTCFFSAH